MKQDSLSKFVEGMRVSWGRRDADLIMRSQELVEALVQSSVDAPWASEMRENIEESRELYRDPEHGFVLLSYTEMRGRYRPPHDHGLGWVIYAVQKGEMEMRTLERATCGGSEVTPSETFRMHPGESRLFLPGDIHDTRCLSDSVLVIRLTSLDLKSEKSAGRMREYEIAK